MSVPPGSRPSGSETVRTTRDAFLAEFSSARADGLVSGAGDLGALAAFKPWELGMKADPFASAPAGIRPEWYFMFMFETLKFIRQNRADHW